MNLFFKILCAVLLTASHLFSKAPPLSTADVQSTINKMLKSHVSFSHVNTLLLQRTLCNYINELDPLKIYFLEEEIAQWINPTTELLNQLVTQYNQGNISEFIKIHHLFSVTAARQKKIEANLTFSDQENPAPPFTNPSRIPWAQTEQDLQQRIQELHQWQVSLHKLLDQQSSETSVLEKIIAKKRRKENSIIGSNETQQGYEILTFLLKSFALAMDPHTSYLTPAEAQQFIMQVQKKLSGIGVHLRDDLDGFTIINILDAAPEKNHALLRINDKIIAVNGTSVVGMDFFDVVHLIRGPQGSTVSVTVMRHIADSVYEKQELLLHRGEIALQEGRVEVEEKTTCDGIIGTVKLHSFYRDKQTSSSQDTASAIQQMNTAAKVQGIILDLRNNGGGLLQEAIAVTGLFLKQGVVASIKDSRGKIHHLRNLTDTPLWTGPLIVLINRLSASASELTAQALQDYGRAIIVGDASSYGKGTFQSMTLDMLSNQANPKGELVITEGCYYAPSGKSPQLWGVSADIEVPGPFSKEEIGEQFTKYPLPPTTIKDNFEDSFSDVSPFFRISAKGRYRKSPQLRLVHLKNMIPTLLEHSQERIKNNPLYQEFLKTLEEKTQKINLTENISQKDLQLEEAYLIMEELISMSKSTSSEGG